MSGLVWRRIKCEKSSFLRALEVSGGRLSEWLKIGAVIGLILRKQNERSWSTTH